MTELINKYRINIQVGVAIVAIISISVFVYRFSAYAFIAANTEIRMTNAELRITKVEDNYKTLATKDDIIQLKKDLKDYIDKK